MNQTNESVATASAKALEQALNKCRRIANCYSAVDAARCANQQALDLAVPLGGMAITEVIAPAMEIYRSRRLPIAKCLDAVEALFVSSTGEAFRLAATDNASLVQVVDAVSPLTQQVQRAPHSRAIPRRLYTHAGLSDMEEACDQYFRAIQFQRAANEAAVSTAKAIRALQINITLAEKPLDGLSEKWWDSEPSSNPTVDLARHVVNIALAGVFELAAAKGQATLDLTAAAVAEIDNLLN